MQKRLSIAAATVCLFMAPMSAALAQAAPAPAASSAYTTAATPLGTLLDDPAAKAVIDKHIPGLTSNPSIDQGRAMTLKAIQPYMAGKVTDEVLVAIDADFAKLPPKPAK